MYVDNNYNLLFIPHYIYYMKMCREREEKNWKWLWIQKVFRMVIVTFLISFQIEKPFHSLDEEVESGLNDMLLNFVIIFAYNLPYNDE